LIDISVLKRYSTYDALIFMFNFRYLILVYGKNLS
jgi:hypothetical protein